MRLERVKDLMNKFDLQIDELKKERSNFKFKVDVDTDLYIPGYDLFLSDDDARRFSYISGKIDLFKQMKEVMIESTCFDEIGDLAYVKDSYESTYSDFIDGYIDSLFALKDIL